MSTVSLVQLRSILLQNVTMLIFVVINFNATFPSFFFVVVFFFGGGGGAGRGEGWAGKAPIHNTNANREVPHWNEYNTKILK